MKQRWVPGLVMACTLFPAVMYGQSGAIRKGNVCYLREEYAQAAKAYERGLRHQSDRVAEIRRADSYSHLGNYAAAEKAWEPVVYSRNAEPLHYLQYAEALQANGNYNKAREFFMRYAETGDNPTLGRARAEACGNVMLRKQDSLAWDLKPMQYLNTAHSEMVPMSYKQGIAFTANRSHTGWTRNLSARKGREFYDLYYAPRGTDARFSQSDPIKGGMNGKLHDGPAVFFYAGHRAYITRSMNVRGKLSKEERENRMGIYFTELTGNTWDKGTLLPFCAANYNTQHPTLTLDEKTMIFASDRPGGMGGYDLWRVVKVGQTWSEPENMGPEVNSDGDELFPYLLKDTVLYFASNRTGGFGGLDLYAVRHRGHEWVDLRNAGYPLNSSRDDFGIAWEPDKNFGYFTSNRPGGAGEDDIYMFRKYRNIEVQVVDSRSGAPVPGAEVEMMDLSQKIYRYTTDSLGQAAHVLTLGQEMQVRVNKERWFTYKGTRSFRDLGPADDYRWVVKLEENRSHIVNGLITDAATGRPIQDASIRLISKNEKYVKANEKGQFEDVLEPQRQYTLIISREAYKPVIYEFETQDMMSPDTFSYAVKMTKGNFLMVQGTVTDRDRGQKMENASVKVVDLNTDQEVYSGRTRYDGNFYMVLDPGRQLSLIVSRENFLTSRQDLNPLKSASVKTDTLELAMRLVPLEVDKVAKTIYYEYNQSALGAMSKRELNELAYLMLDNPSISVELSSHTDARGTADYNLKLSNKRAQAAADYLYTRGVARERVVAVGYGEAKLKNQCVDATACSEEQHAQNRRTELRIIRIDTPQTHAVDALSAPVGSR